MNVGDVTYGLISIPGFARIIAEVFIAETGGDMSVFLSAGHLAPWREFRTLDMAVRGWWAVLTVAVDAVDAVMVDSDGVDVAKALSA